MSTIISGISDDIGRVYSALALFWTSECILLLDP